MSRHPLVQKVGQFLQHLDAGLQGTVVAVSGGADSVALLRTLITMRFDPTAGPLVIAHLNHQLRREESDADEAFVRQLHTALTATGVPGLELRCGRADVAARARADRENLESTARRVRYAWLSDLAREFRLSWVATGHTADDQAETVLHRLLRGTGLKGLRGIAARRALAPSVELIRPLLTVTRAEVLAYLETEKQSYRDDSSNADLRYTRNRIRHELLPHLATHYNPAIVRILGRLAEQAAEAYRGEEARAQALLAETERSRAGPLLVFDRQRLAAAPRHLVRAAFRLAWAREGWSLDGMRFADWERLAALASGEVPAVDLPGRIRACCREHVVQIGPVL